MPSPTPGASPHTHGRSEVWERPALTATIRRTCRTLGARLRTLRVERGYSQEQAAELIGIHAKHLQRVELGSANVTFATLVAAAIAFRVDLQTLLEGFDLSTAPKKPAEPRPRKRATQAKPKAFAKDNSRPAQKTKRAPR